MKPRYLVTGIDRAGKRFRIETDSYIHAMGINLWQGSKWRVSEDGKKKLLHTVTN